MIPSRTLGGCCVIRASLYNAAFALLAILCACLIYYVVHLEYLLSQSRRKCPCLSDEDSFQPRPLFNYFSPASVPDTTTTFPTTERTVEDVSSKDKKAPLEKAPPDTCGDDIPLGKQLVCPEKHLGAPKVWANSRKTLAKKDGQCWNSTWVLDKDPAKCGEQAREPQWGKILTVLLVVQGKKRLTRKEVEKRFQAYKNVTIFVSYAQAANKDEDDEEDGPLPPNVKVVRSKGGESPWTSMARRAETPFVMVGRDLRAITHWARLERAIRLLQGDPKLAVVAGSTRNSTGHWRATCLQAQVRNYHLELRPGYSSSRCDCMECGALPGRTPFITRTHLAQGFPLDPTVGPDAAFISWFLTLKSAGLKVLLCPDIMHLTSVGDRWPEKISREDWKSVARVHMFQGVVTNFSPKVKHAFKCGEVGLKCDPMKDGEKHLLLPWCCIAGYARILLKLEEAAVQFNISYELDTGSVLGAVKMGHFLPWDIDGDIAMTSRFMKMFSASGGKAHKMLKAAGVNISPSYKDSSNTDVSKFAGYVGLQRSGVNVEVQGWRSNLSAGMECAPELGGVPTRVFVSSVWTRTHASPGLYARSRYGRGYLSHAQSWRHVGMTDHELGYPSGHQWRACAKAEKHKHRCLSEYPTDGNLMFHPETFTAWRAEDPGPD